MLFWFGHGCSGNRRQVKDGCYYGLGHGCSGKRRQVEHGCYYGLSMDALVNAGKSNKDVMMVWAWMLLQPQASRTRMLFWFGHGCSGNRMLLDHERYYACSAVIMPRCLAHVDASTSKARSKLLPDGAGFSRAPHMALEPCAKL